MKIVLLLLLVTVLNAQNVQFIVAPNKFSQITVPAGKVNVSPDGKYLAVTSLTLNGIDIYSVSDGKKQTITQNEFAGWGMAWNNSSTLIASREKETDRFFIALRSLQGNELFRTDLFPFLSVPVWSNSGGTVTWVNNDGVVETYSILKNDELSAPFNGKTVQLIGTSINSLHSSVSFPGEILSTEISPDKKHLAVHVAGYGIYMYNFENNSLTDLGKGEAPKWLNNEYFVYSEITDDGRKIMSGEVYLKNTNGTYTAVLTEQIEQPVFYPSTSAAGDIFCTDENGTVYYFKITITE